VLEEIARLIELRTDFAWESTLSGLTYANQIRAMKQLGYHVETIYLRLASPRLALRRIGGRVPIMYKRLVLGRPRECTGLRSMSGRTARSSPSAPEAAVSFLASTPKLLDACLRGDGAARAKAGGPAVQGTGFLARRNRPDRELHARISSLGGQRSDFALIEEA
jgi:hypothetical protein